MKIESITNQGVTFVDGTRVDRAVDKDNGHVQYIPDMDAPWSYVDHLTTVVLEFIVSERYGMMRNMLVIEQPNSARLIFSLASDVVCVEVNMILLDRAVKVVSLNSDFALRDVIAYMTN